MSREAKTEEKKIGLTKFVQKNSIDTGIEAILKINYSKSLMTETEWNKKVQEVLSHKVTQ